MIEVQHVSYTYSDGTQALRDVSLICPPEHIFAILGFSGSGKTTLLNCIARFLQPQTGTIRLDGEDIVQMEAADFRKKVGVIFQDLNLFPHLSVLENMTLAPRRVQKRPEEEARAEAMEMLERLRIADLATSYPAQVSGGQAQRVAIARGLMLKPEVMLLDEPTSALDAKTTMEFAQWLRELQSDTGFIIVTHDLPFAKETAKKGVFMQAGQVQEEGLIRDIAQQASGSVAHV